MERRSIQVPADQERLDLYLSRTLDLPRSKIRNMLEAGDVLLNGRVPSKAGVKLKAGDRLEITFSPPSPSALQSQPIPLDIVYEDDALLAINKQAGLVVHPAIGHQEGTVVNALLYHFEKLSKVDPARPGIVHRLDKDTSGLLLIAKTDAAHLELSRQFKDREMEKIYAAIVSGNVPHDECTIDKPIGRHPKNRKKMAVVATGRHAVTRYKVVSRYRTCTFLECRIETGRTHQIRVHLASIGHPVVGDPVYGKRDETSARGRQMLHAWKLKLKHPTTQEPLFLEAPLPSDMQRLLEALSRERE